MKKFSAALICSIYMLLMLFPVTVFAWETPSFDLGIVYNEKKDEVVVEYRVKNAAGIESADFRLKYNPDILKFKASEVTKIKNTVTEVSEIDGIDDKIAIQFIDLYYIKPEDCDEDGSAVIATLTFDVIDSDAAETAFAATADSCAMDPDSKQVSPERLTKKVSLVAKENESSNESQAENPNVKKVIIAAAVTFAVFIGGLAVVVIKYRKQP